ncbi:MAG: MFS transporter [Anaerolineae bacterium]|nr:MFS transporter [Anaerolineae bacterium]
MYFDSILSIPTARIGTILAIAQLISAAASLAMPLLVGRVGKPRTILFGGLARTLCLLPLVLIPHWVPATGGLIGVILFAGLVRPAFTAFHQESVTPRWRAMISGATTMTAGLGFAVAALGGGYIIPIVGYRGLFLAGAGVSLVGSLVFWFRFILPDRRSAERPADVLAPKLGT